MIGLGLGLAIDYTLFLVTRFREELAGRRRAAAAVAHDDEHRRAGRSSSAPRPSPPRSITLTVFPLGFLQSMGIAGAGVALVAGLASLVDRARAVRALGRASSPASAAGADDRDGRWYRLAHAVMRRPASSRSPPAP